MMHGQSSALAPKIVDEPIDTDEVSNDLPQKEEQKEKQTDEQKKATPEEIRDDRMLAALTAQATKLQEALNQLGPLV